MTRDHRRKKAVRAQAAATGRTYLDAATSLRPATVTPLLAEPLRRAIATALRAAGWPLEIEHHPQANALRSYAGPATVDVARAQDPAGGLSGDEHPDDPDVFDLTSPLKVAVRAPLITDVDPELGRIAGIDFQDIPADRPPAAIAAEIDQMVGVARQRDLRESPLHGECGICGDRYTEAGLFESSNAPVAVCPCCAFDGDLLGADPDYLAYQIDQTANHSLALPAGWTAVQVLLCCLGGKALRRRLLAAWRVAGTLFEPADVWSDPARAWLWLPPAPQRPPTLAEFGCGASLAAITATLNHSYPDLRARYEATRGDEIDQYVDDEYGDDGRPGDDDKWKVPEQIIDRFWPAVIAYAVAMLTQRAERPEHRSPWHVLESLELGDWIRVLDPALDSYQVETVLRVGVLTVRDILDPDPAHAE